MTIDDTTLTASGLGWRIDRVPLEPTESFRNRADAAHRAAFMAALPRPNAEVFVLFMETSDQRGTSEPVGVYSTEGLANMAEGQVKTHRTHVKRFELNATPVPPRGYTL